MELIETAIFTRQVEATWSAEEYREFQLYLIAFPEKGAVIPGGGGLRKVRWGLRGRGKRGGARVIYYWSADTHQIFLLFLYPKNARSDLTAGELRQLRRLIADD